LKGASHDRSNKSIRFPNSTLLKARAWFRASNQDFLSSPNLFEDINMLNAKQIKTQINAAPLVTPKSNGWTISKVRTPNAPKPSPPRS
jgi:hypothetical protein